MDSIAEVVDFFFLMCYAFVNIICFMHSVMGAPNWRPRFVYYHWLVLQKIRTEFFMHEFIAGRFRSSAQFYVFSLCSALIGTMPWFLWPCVSSSTSTLSGKERRRNGATAFVAWRWRRLSTVLWKYLKRTLIRKIGGIF